MKHTWNAYTCTQVHRYMRAYACTYTYAHTHIHTHTYTHLLPSGGPRCPAQRHGAVQARTPARSQFQNISVQSAQEKSRLRQGPRRIQGGGGRQEESSMGMSKKHRHREKVDQGPWESTRSATPTASSMGTCTSSVVMLSQGLEVTSSSQRAPCH